ncbi:LysR family transcriptional regulator [Pseudomonas sp. Ag1]|uniref:LysR family transcriptional regulator n=1 Tax=Pseudomonas sp. Ag1 TaxID=1197727 RepID=UPI000272C8A3|nr:LysR family transcriptional regulator [Pseudomonas sp. Ag1]EJF69753.1 LysR family transcriptional regulator [Pseudomonas sp. Ag1]
MQNLKQLLEVLNLEEMVTFLAVVEAKSFVGASLLVSKNPTIVSRRISQLEKRMGVSLLTRTTRRVNLTEVGRNYYQRIRTLLDELANAGEEAMDYAASPQGLIRVSLPMAFGHRCIAPLLPGFLQQYPKIRIEAEYTDHYVDVVSGGFDVAIRLSASLADSSLTARKIASYNTALYASPQYLAQHDAINTPEDLADHNCLGFSSISTWPNWVLKNGATELTVRPIGSLVSGSSEALLPAALNGMGIIMVADWLVGSAVQEGSLVRVLEGWFGTIDGGVYAVMPPGRLFPIKTRVFVDELARALNGGDGYVYPAREYR